MILVPERGIGNRTPSLRPEARVGLKANDTKGLREP